MPIRVTAQSTGGVAYGSPFVGPIDHTAQIPVNIASLSAAEVDAQGYLKPGVPLSAAGALVGTGVAVFGVTIEAIKLTAAGAARTGTFDIAVATIGQVNQDVVEDNLGRALTGFEVAGFGLAGSTLKLL